IVILLLTYLVLNFINPQIVNLKDPGLESPCTESMCYEQCVEDGVEPPECEAICSGGDKCYEKKEIGTPKSCTKLSQVECGERSDCKWDGKCVQDSGF
ncbi:MAG: hypothetical protein Q8P37_00025, partial [Candidatus Spechtbacteria bacterium]|nr:hypothetical protein [Candidatus Spechtbacteria bacterium]